MIQGLLQTHVRSILNKEHVPLYVDMHLTIVLAFKCITKQILKDMKEKLV